MSKSHTNLHEDPIQIDTNLGFVDISLMKFLGLPTEGVYLKYGIKSSKHLVRGCFS